MAINLSEIFGKPVKLVKDPSSHKNPNAQNGESSGEQSTALPLTTAMAALAALNQQPAYAPANTQDQVNALMNTPTAANILGNAAQGLNYGPSPGGSSFDSSSEN
ncbi:MAG: hypothetical protein K0S29_134 [Gammaproteobacteria bacterium]|jgi:hypothetical protein|nr:hypothetical protein [Gammaproteobacteria bacterium]